MKGDKNMNKLKRTHIEKSACVYCIAVIKMKKSYAGSDLRVDQYAELVGIDDHIATLVSRKFGVSKEDIEYISFSFTTNSNAHLGFCGTVTDVILDNGAAIYTIDIPKKKQLNLNDGTIIELPNENLIKYNNIHKSQRTSSKKTTTDTTIDSSGNQVTDDSNNQVII